MEIDDQFQSGGYFGRSQIEDTLRSRIDSAAFHAVATNNIVQYGVNSFRYVRRSAGRCIRIRDMALFFPKRFIHYALQNNDLKQVRTALPMGSISLRCTATGRG